MSHRAVLLNSGGVDSRVVAHIASRELGYALHSFYVDWNAQTRAWTVPAARHTAALYCTDHEAMPWHYDLWRERAGGIWGYPYMSTMMHLFAAQYAVYRGCETVFSGYRQDVAGPDYLVALEHLLNAIRLPHRMLFSAPLFDVVDFAAVHTRATALGIPLADTYSCQRAGPCGECWKCRNRQPVGLE